MHLTHALESLQRISEDYLFSEIAVTTRSFFRHTAGKYDPKNACSPIHGVAIGYSKNLEYFLQVFHSEEIEHQQQLASDLHISDEYIKFILQDPFAFHGRRRPLSAGCSIGPLTDDVSGTLGCFVKDRKGQEYILSNYHVLLKAGSDWNDFIIQPSRPNGGMMEDTVGMYAAGLPFHPGIMNKYDAALIAISPDIDLNLYDSAGVRKLKGHSAADFNTLVYKLGARTKKTFGIVSALHANVKLDIHGQTYFFQDQLIVQGTDATFEIPQLFSKPGDSGSLVIDAEKSAGVGLLFAGSPSGRALVTPISGILREFDVEILC